VHGSFDPVALVLLVAAWIYIAGSCVQRWARARGTDRAVPGWRLAAFLTGLGLVWLTLLPPLATLDHRLLTAHMLKHLILMTLAAPLLLLGDPIPRLGRGLGRKPASGILGGLATHPIVCWLAGTVTVLVWHVPSVLSLAMHSTWMHLAQTASFLVAGVLFWLPVIPPWSSRTRWSAWSVPLYLLLATLPCDALSAFLAFCGRPLYASALSPAPPEELLADQQRAGALMWVWVTLVYLVPAVWQVLRLLAPPGPRSSPAAGAH
jgi:putative membrane protein